MKIFDWLPFKSKQSFEKGDYVKTTHNKVGEVIFTTNTESKIKLGSRPFAINNKDLTKVNELTIVSYKGIEYTSPIEKAKIVIDFLTCCKIPFRLRSKPQQPLLK